MLLIFRYLIFRLRIIVKYSFIYLIEVGDLKFRIYI